MSKTIKVLVLSLLVASTPNAGKSQIVNDDGVFANAEVCSEYRDFLADRTVEDASQCHALSEFLISNQDLGLSNYVRKLVELGAKESALTAMAQTFIAAMLGDALSAFQWSELANKRVTFKMASSQDMERAAIYSHLLSEIQRDAVMSLCREDADCTVITPLNSVQAILGSAFSDLDNVRADILLLCLLRTDGYLLPVREVLQSPRFERCSTSPN